MNKNKTESHEAKVIRLESNLTKQDIAILLAIADSDTVKKKVNE